MPKAGVNDAASIPGDHRCTSNSSEQGECPSPSSPKQSVTAKNVLVHGNLLEVARLAVLEGIALLDQEALLVAGLLQAAQQAAGLGLEAAGVVLLVEEAAPPDVDLVGQLGDLGLPAVADVALDGAQALGQRLVLRLEACVLGAQAPHLGVHVAARRVERAPQLLVLVVEAAHLVLQLGDLVLQLPQLGVAGLVVGLERVVLRADGLVRLAEVVLPCDDDV